MMRPDQAARIQELSEKLVEVVLLDADPDNWAGAGKLPVDLTQQERGDAYWCRKMAAASLMLLCKVETLTQTTQAANATEAEKSDEQKQLDQELARAEKEAARLLDSLQNAGQRKAAFDAKVHAKR